jgi:hypothetical protein
MNAVSGIFMALAIVFGGGYALEKIQRTIERAALEQIHHGMPSLSAFTNRLTCSKISNAGTLVPAKCGQGRQRERRK